MITHTHTHRSTISWLSINISTWFKQNMKKTMWVLSSGIRITLHVIFHCSFCSRCNATPSKYIPRSQPARISTDCLLFQNHGLCAAKPAACPLKSQLYGSYCDLVLDSCNLSSKRPVHVLTTEIFGLFMFCIWAQRINISLYKIFEHHTFISFHMALHLLCVV